MNQAAEELRKAAKAAERLADAIDGICVIFAEWEEIAHRISHHRQCIRILRRKQYTLGLTYFERQRLRQLMQ